MEPREIATNHTLSFLKERLPNAPCRILEVGCGLGHLAKALSDLGHEVLAIDTSEDAVNSAKKLNVNARACTVEETVEGDFDFILFTRSLHHIHPIGRCLKSARSKLKTNGTVIVDDFGYDLMDEPTVIWFQGLKNVTEPFFGSEEHSLHKAMELEASLREHFSGLEIQKDVPYLYRYLIPGAPQSKEGYESVAAAFTWEKTCISRGEIKGIGLRLVGRN